MTFQDKRLSPRYLLPIPVRFRSFEIGCAELEIPTQALNISRNGLFFASPQRLKVGSKLSLNLRVPTELSGSVFSELRCRGRVVHEQELKDGTIGYGVEIEQMSPALHLPLQNGGEPSSARL